MAIWTYTPRADRSQLVALDKNGATTVALVRGFSDAQWRPATLRPSAANMRGWLEMDEPSWVARCLFDELPHSARKSAAESIPQPPLSDQQVAGLAGRLKDNRGPEALWNAALTAKIAGMPYADRLLEETIHVAAEDAPELGPWCNYVALLGNCSSAAPDIAGVVKAIKSIARIFAGQRQAERLIMDIQTQLDLSEQTQQAIRSEGLGGFRWKWTVPGAPEISLLFPRPATATEWLCGASLTPEGNVRASLRELRTKVRSAQVVLIDKNAEMVPTAPLINMIDSITAGQPLNEDALF